MKILYLKRYKWLLSQKQRVKNHFSGYRRYDALAKHIKPLEPLKGSQCPDCNGCLRQKNNARFVAQDVGQSV